MYPTRIILAAACSCGLFTGCGEEAPIESATPPSPPPSVSLSLDAAGATASPATAPGPIQVVPVDFSEAAPPEKQFTTIVESANSAYFAAEGEAGVPRNVAEFLNRAIQVYEERMTESDEGDGPTWPGLTDLNQLVRYRILRALPAAPPGKKIVLDPQTKVVSLEDK